MRAGKQDLHAYHNRGGIVEIIPAIDLRGGKCVRLIRGDVRDETVYSHEPVSMAKHWKSLGAKRLHIVDLDGAFEGKPVHFELISRMVNSIKIPVQVGGGIRTIETMKQYFDAGVDRILIGTIAHEDRGLLKKAINRFGDAVCIAIDAQVGKLATRGWKKITRKMALRHAQELEKLGINRFVYTDIRRDGMLIGPNIRGIRTMVKGLKSRMIASGGISGMEDLEKLMPLVQFGVEGVIVGKALYTGAIDLKKAVRRFSSRKKTAG